MTPSCVGTGESLCESIGDSRVLALVRILCFQLHHWVADGDALSVGNMRLIVGLEELRDVVVGVEDLK